MGTPLISGLLVIVSLALAVRFGDSGPVAVIVEAG